ncbi:DNA polymerase Y family protein [Alteromonas sp. C1M14]|uniref:Y-family DNA polymerase n=1 Tax=Alteromonas sp. C1M14 TaxID=2841567 RepID=UPI001C0952A4|nr:DNA polymerase Y family protein [Alteromonas sp. C1M14]MBU2979826.1 DNA polymerase Y family protein [Alteromonas sp. C1M14]
MLWLHLHFYQLSLEHCAQAINSEDPWVVYQASSNEIKQLNHSAKKAGIEIGMGLAEAAALTTPLRITDYCEQTERQLLNYLACSLYQCAAEIALIPPHSLTIRIDTLTRYYGGVNNVWFALKSLLSQLEHQYHFASAWTPEAAEALARAQTNRFFTQQADIKKALYSLPLSRLLLSSKQHHSLARSGVKHVGQLFELPGTELGKRFDNKLLQYLYACRGETYPQRLFYHPPEQFDEHITVPFEIENTQHLLPYMTKVIERMGTFLRLRNKATQAVELTLHYREAEATELTIRKATLYFSDDEWLQLITLKLSTLILSAPVISFQVTALGLQEVGGQDNDFFHNRRHIFARQQLAGKLAARLGESSINTPKWPYDHRMQPDSKTMTHLTRYYSDLPGVVLKQPAPLSGTPKIEFGPVRVETAWWSDEKHKRDYYIAKNQHGQRMQIFREDNRWFINGWYV